MASRKRNSRESERMRSRAGGVGSERIRSGDVRRLLLRSFTKKHVFLVTRPSKKRRKRTASRPSRIAFLFLRDEIDLKKFLKAKTTGVDHKSGSSSDCVVARSFHWQFSHAKDYPIMEDPDSVAHLVRHFKPAGCPLPSLRNMFCFTF